MDFFFINFMPVDNLNTIFFYSKPHLYGELCLSIIKSSFHKRLKIKSTIYNETGNKAISFEQF